MSRTRSRIISYSIFLIVAMLLLSCAGLFVPLDLAFNLAFGWIVFLWSVVPQIHVNQSGLFTFIACLVLLAVGSQAFLRWLYGSMTGMPWKWRWTTRLIEATVLLFIAGLATTGVAHQVGWLMASEERWTSNLGSGLVERWTSNLGSGRIAAQRAQSMSNLKNFALALDAYHTRRKAFPPGATFDKLGRPLHSWMTVCLPDVDQQNLYKQIDFDLPWDDPANATYFQQDLLIYRNSGFGSEFKQDERGYALTHYAGNVHLLGGDRVWTKEAITYGTSVTIQIGEVAGNFKPWGDPVNWRDPALGINKSPRGFGGPFPGGANFAFADGSVRFIRDTINPRVFEALGTPNGGEKIQDHKF